MLAELADGALRDRAHNQQAESAERAAQADCLADND